MASGPALPPCPFPFVSVLLPCRSGHSDWPRLGSVEIDDRFRASPDKREIRDRRIPWLEKPGACDRCNQFRHTREIVLKQSAGNPRPYQRGSRRRHLIVTVHMRRRDFMTLIGGGLVLAAGAARAARRQSSCAR